MVLGGILNMIPTGELVSPSFRTIYIFSDHMITYIIITKQVCVMDHDSLTPLPLWPESGQDTQSTQLERREWSIVWADRNWDPNMMAPAVNCPPPILWERSATTS